MNFLLKLFSIYLLFRLDSNYVSGKKHHQFHRFKNDEEIINAPYMVSIRLNYKDSRWFGTGQVCSGTLISQDTILSAASCLYHNDHLLEARHIRIVAGSSLQSEFTSATHLARLRHFIIHDKFNRTTMENNIALLYISEPIDKDNKQISPIRQSKYSLEPETQCGTKGWVKVNKGRLKYADKLQSFSVSVLDPQNCDRIKRPNNLCAVFQDNISCGLDVGSPLVCDDMVYGIIYRHTSCNNRNHTRHANYLDISSYYSWIEAHRNLSTQAKCDIIIIIVNFLLLQFFI